MSIIEHADWLKNSHESQGEQIGSQRWLGRMSMWLIDCNFD